MHDFEVDIVGLAKAAQAAADAIQTFKDKDVVDVVPTEGDIANDTLWAAVDEFQDRWERGVNDLCDDISEVAGRLGKVAQTYIEFDEKAKATFESAAKGLSTLIPAEGIR